MKILYVSLYIDCTCYSISMDLSDNNHKSNVYLTVLSCDLHSKICNDDRKENEYVQKASGVNYQNGGHSTKAEKNIYMVPLPELPNQENNHMLHFNTIDNLEIGDENIYYNDDIVNEKIQDTEIYEDLVVDHTISNDNTKSIWKDRKKTITGLIFIVILILIACISIFGGNISKTAEFVGMERSALHRKLKLLGLTDKKAKAGE